MQAVIITIGDEILLGQILDTNSRYIATGLTKIGVDVVEMYSIPDKRDEIAFTVDHALKQADVVIVTGGLGPTKDDITKRVLTDYFDTRLVMNPEIYHWLEEMIEGRGMRMNENNRGQAMLPEQCRILKNYKGTASGMWFERDGKILVSLPGVPFEMEHLMDKYVLPDLKSRYPDLQLEYLMLKVYDVPESELAHHLEAWEDAIVSGLGLAYLPSPGLVKLRITAKGEAVSLLPYYYDTLKQALQQMRFTEGENESLETLFAAQCIRRGVTIATAESCTGGYIAHLITAVPGSSAFFKGSVVAYSNEVKTNVLGVSTADIENYGAVSEQVVVQMAQGARKAINADYAVATSGVAGPAGGTPDKPVGTVWIAVATPTETIARRFAFSFGRERNIAKASLKALELLMEHIG